MLQFNAVADPAKHAGVTAALGIATAQMTDLEAAAAGVAKVRALMDEVGVPSLPELRELSADDMEEVAKLSAEHVCSPDNARTIEFDD